MTLLDRPPAFPDNPLQRRVREMDTVRRLATQIVGGRHGQRSSLSDDDWESLCSYARGAKDERAAIARVIQQAYRLRDDPRLSSAVEPLNASEPSAHLEPTAGAGFSGADRSDFEASGHPVQVLELTGPLLPLDFAAPVRPASGAPLAAHSVVPELVDPALKRSTQRRSRRRTGSKRSHHVLDEVRRERWLSVASWVRSIGLIILLFVAWQLWGTAIAQHHSQDELQRQFRAKVAHVITKPSPTFQLVPSTTRLADPPQGTVMAQLQIPKIDLDEYVVSGTDQDDLAKGPGHYLGTAMPGQAGNVAIAGHRTTHGAPFNRLAELAVGDPIYLTTTTGQRLTYIVSATPVPVSPSDVSVLNNFGDNRLTLTTCNPEYSARQRLIVVAAYLPPEARHPAPIAKGTGTPYKLGASVTSGWNTSLLPLAALIGGALVALGLLNRRLSRIYGSQGRWFILVPVWLALLLALFEVLTNFLPASV